MDEKLRLIKEQEELAKQEMQNLKYMQKKQKEKVDQEVKELIEKKDSHKKIQEMNLKAINKE